MSVSPTSLALKTKTMFVFSAVVYIPWPLPSVQLLTLAHKTYSVKMGWVDERAKGWSFNCLPDICHLLSKYYNLPFALFFPQINTLEIFKQYSFILRWVTFLMITCLTVLLISNENSDEKGKDGLPMSVCYTTQWCF